MFKLVFFIINVFANLLNVLQIIFFAVTLSVFVPPFCFSLLTASISTNQIAEWLIYGGCQYLSIIGRGRAKYRDLSVVSRSVVCRCRRQILDLRDTDKSRFARTKFNNCFIIHLHSFVLCFLRFFLQVSKTTHLPKVQQSGRHCMFTKIESNAHAQSIICS